MRPLTRDVGIVLVIAIMSIAMITPDHRAFLAPWPWTGLGAVLPSTVWTAIKVWSFWAAGAAVIAAIVLRIEPRFGLVDTTIAGLIGVWIFAFLAGNAFGPVGLFHTWVLWALVAIGGVWAWRTPPVIELRHLSPGQVLVLLTCALMLPAFLLEQLGAPVPPFMDILATPAAAQRIATFGRYLPFDNDPYGYWNPSSQLPGLELFYGMLAVGGRSLGVLADTAAMTPMAFLLILTTYRLGKAIAGDVAGGMATLFICATVLFQTLPYMHGRFVTFVLVGAGLAFVLDERRNRTRLILGALALGTAVANHAIIGALGMAVASFALLGGGVVSSLAGIGLMAGASLVALPTIHVGLRIPVPYPVMPVEQMLGVLLIVFAARGVRPRTSRRLRWLGWGLALFVVYGLLWHPEPFLGNNHAIRFPLLVYAGGLGLALMVLTDRGSSPPLLGAVTFALLLGMGIEYASNRWHAIFTDPGTQVAMHDWFYKVDYWLPYMLMFPAAYLATCLARVTSIRVATFVVLLSLFVPWRNYIDPHATPMMDPNYHQQAIPETWCFKVETGMRGHWGNTRDRRWAQSPAELELSRVLMREVEAGRITPATHVVHLSAFISLYQDVLLFSVYTGINDDPYLTNHAFNASDAGSRLRPIEEFHARLAERPPYVVIHNDLPVGLAPDALRGYEEIFNQDGIRLLREAGVQS